MSVFDSHTPGRWLVSVVRAVAKKLQALYGIVPNLVDRKHMEPDNRSRHHYHLKGQSAEQFLHTLAVKSFFMDWCYPNPHWPDGKELCDLLIVFDNVAIIWQVKDLKLNNEGRYRTSEVQKNIRQLAGARRKLFDLKMPIDLENPRRGSERFDPTQITDVYLISALLGEGESASLIVDTLKQYTVHLFNREFTEIALTELDTIADFTDYLRIKETFIREKKENLLIQGGEQELLAYYLTHNRSFDQLLTPAFVLIEEGHWAGLQDHPQYRARQGANKISYGWDFLIDRAHEGGTTEYERIARELARPNRFVRRTLAHAFYDGTFRAHRAGPEGLRRVIFELEGQLSRGTTYCFLFVDEAQSREDRCAMLQATCIVARGTIRENWRVIGIATEQHIAPTRAYDFLFLDLPEWTNEHQEDMEVFQRELGILIESKLTPIDAKEYLDVPRSE